MITNKSGQILTSSFDGVMPEDAKSKFGKRLAEKHLKKYLKGAEMFTYKGRFFFVKRTLRWL